MLADNISLLEQLHSIHAPGNISAAGPSRPRMRDVLTLPSWLYCFLTYTAILTTDPTTKDKLAYARLMILEDGHLDYDSPISHYIPNAMHSLYTRVALARTNLLRLTA